MQEIVITDKELQANIAENVRRFRGDRSLREIAAACSTEQWTCYAATIQQVEARRHMPGTALLVRLAEVLGVTPNDLTSAPKRRARAS